MYSYQLKPKDIGDNEWQIKNTSSRLEVCLWILSHFKEILIQTVIEWEGERETSYCTDYYDMVDKIWDNANGWDGGSSSGHHSNIKFISDYILLLAKQKKEMMQQIKKDKIERLKKELEELEG